MSISLLCRTNLLTMKYQPQFVPSLQNHSNTDISCFVQHSNWESNSLKVGIQNANRNLCRNSNKMVKTGFSKISIKSSLTLQQQFNSITTINKTQQSNHIKWSLSQNNIMHAKKKESSAVNFLVMLSGFSNYFAKMIITL